MSENHNSVKKLNNNDPILYSGMQTTRKHSVLTSIQANNLCPCNSLKYFSRYFYIAEFCYNETSVACKINKVTFIYKFKHKHKTI